MPRASKRFAAGLLLLLCVSFLFFCMDFITITNIPPPSHHFKHSIVNAATKNEEPQQARRGDDLPTFDGLMAVASSTYSSSNNKGAMDNTYTCTHSQRRQAHLLMVMMLVLVLLVHSGMYVYKYINVCSLPHTYVPTPLPHTHTPPLQSHPLSSLLLLAPPSLSLLPTSLGLE